MSKCFFDAISQERVTQCATVLYTFFGLRLMYVGARGEDDKDEEFEEAPVKTPGDSMCSWRSPTTLERVTFSPSQKGYQELPGNGPGRGFKHLFIFIPSWGDYYFSHIF